MANETKVVTGTQKTLEANGASCANNVMVALDDASYGIVADGLSYPDAEFQIAVTYATAPTVNKTLDLYAQELNFDGTNDEQTPTATYKKRYICSFVVDAVTTIQYINSGLVRNVPREAFYFLHNNDTGQTISAGWTGKVIPRSLGPT